MKRSLILLALLAGCADGTPEKKMTGAPGGPGAPPRATGTGRGKAGGPNPVVVIKTNKGTIRAELLANEAPVTVENFLKYVDDRHYDGTVFHRVIPDFMVQGGGLTKAVTDAQTPEEFKRAEKPTRDPIKNESSNGLVNERGTLAMARTSLPDSATAQFFINLKHNRFLDRARARDGVGYAVFGRVIDGMDVVDKIKDVPTRAIVPEDIENVPVEPVVIESIRREEKKPGEPKK